MRNIKFLAMINQKIKDYMDIKKLKNGGYKLLDETNDIEKLKRLIELGCNPLGYNKGYDLLQTENIEKFKLLIELGCNPLEYDKGFYLLKTNNIEKFEYLIKLGCEYDDELIDSLEKAIIVDYPPLNSILRENKDEIIDMIKKGEITDLHLRNNLIRR